MTDRYAEVAPAIPLKTNSRQTYTYRIPVGLREEITLYRAVTVPIGNRAVVGIIMGTHKRQLPYKTKTIMKAGAVVLTDKQVELARWLARTGQGGLGYTLRLFLPAGVRPADKVPGWAARQAVTPRQLIKSLVAGKEMVLVNGNWRRRQSVLYGLVRYYTKQGWQVLTLVPEKAMLAGGPGVSYSAELKTATATKIWQEVRSGRVEAVRGTQKALFLPFRRLGLVIVEEEQLSTHKLWDQYPRLHNKDGARALARIYHCPLLFTASLPSLEEYGASLANKRVELIQYKPVRAKARVVTFSFNDKLKKHVIPHTLVAQVKRWVKTGEKVLFFYNQVDNRRLAYVWRSNLGQALFKQCTISTSKVFALGRATNFDRVVWFYPERTLSWPDFRSVARGRVLLARLQQLVNDPRRKVVLVTKEPSALVDWLASLATIYGQELKIRERLLLPPYGDQVRIRISAQQARKAAAKSNLVASQIKARLKKINSAGKPPVRVIMRGPYQDKNKTRVWYIILRGPLNVLTALYDDLDVDWVDLTPEEIV